MENLSSKAEGPFFREKEHSGSLITIGWKEFVDLPDFHVRHVKAKIDTGARTSALDVLGYELLEDPVAGTIAELRLVWDRKNPTYSKVVRVPVLRMVLVSNSNGVREYRPLIETSLRIGPISKRVQVTITDRSSMLFRMIVGRRALEGDFLVDVSKKYLLRRNSS